MRLQQLSIASMGACLIGLVVLVGGTVYSVERMRANQDGVADLIRLQKRIDDFSVASDSLLLFGADAGLWRAYQADARDLQQRLRELGATHPAALSAARRVGLIVDDVGAALESGSGPRSGGDVSGPLEIPARSRVIMNLVASHGIALDTALEDALQARQGVIAAEAYRIAGGLATAALLYGALCVVAFGLLRRRVGLPASTLSATVERIRAGNRDARAPVSGSDELAELSQTLNRMLDEREQADVRIVEQRRELEYRGHLLAESQRIAQVGTMCFHVREQRLEWSDETYRIFGVSPETFTPSAEGFVELAHPDDRERLRAQRDATIRGERRCDIELRIVRPDGTQRHVHVLAEAEIEGDGTVDVVNGTVQDISARKQADERLELYRGLIEGSDDLFSIIDRNYRYVVANQAYASLYGLDRTELEGARLADVLGEEFFERHARPPIDRCLAGEPQVFEAERTYRDIGRRQLLIRYYPIAAPDDQVHRIAAIATDITEYKQTRETLEDTERLLDIAGATARLGGWAVDLPTRRISWSNVTCEIHGVPHGHEPSFDEAIGFYAPEHRDRLKELYLACVDEGRPYDDELQIIDTSGARVWVRVIGHPVTDREGRVVRVHGAFQDISARKATEREVRRLAERQRTILESITDAFVTVDREWRFRYINSEAELLMQKPRDALLGKVLWDEFPGAEQADFGRAYRRAMEERITVSLEEYYPPLAKWFDIRVYPSEEGLAIYFQDVTTRRTMLQRLQEQEDRLRHSRDDLAALLETRKVLINSLPAHIAMLDPEGNIIDVNDRWRHFGQANAFIGPDLGIGRNYIEICESAQGDCADEAIEVAQGLREVLFEDRAVFSLEYPCHLPEERRWFRVMINRLVPGAQQKERYGAVAMHIDITERKLAEQELNRLAFEDPFTGAFTRQGFVRTASERLADDWQPDWVIVMLDVKGQRDINDAHGYETGDHLLAALCRRLENEAGEQGLVGRTGGDEFVLLMPTGSGGTPDRRLATLAEAVERPFRLNEASIEVSIHFGYTVTGNRPRDVDSMLREAELALFHVRDDSVQSTWGAYTQQLDNETHERVQLTRDLRRAIDGEQFELHYQPKVELESGRLIAGEALLRWNHPRHGLQSPGVFIPLAERSQLIGRIGDWVLRETCRQLRQWSAAGMEPVPIAVNVSLGQFLLGDFTRTLRETLEEFELEPALLSLEITESVFEQESDMLHRALTEIHDLGVHLSLDDFGTGYSSLLYLQRYPFDEIKVDQGFVRGLVGDRYSRNIVNTVLGIAGALGAEAVAEGVETEVERDALLELGCRRGQGYYYCRPLVADDFRRLLEGQQALPLAETTSGR